MCLCDAALIAGGITAGFMLSGVEDGAAVSLPSIPFRVLSDLSTGAIHVTDADTTAS